MSRPASIWTEYSDTIESAAERFGDHEGMTPERVLQWLLQFEDADLPIAVKVLEEIRYLNTPNIRASSRNIVEIVDAEVEADSQRILFVPISTPGSGAELVARAIRDVENPFRPRMASMVDLARTDLGNEDALPAAIVFLDDFSGTADTFIEWWEVNESIIRPLGADVIFAALLMTSAAMERIRDLGTPIAIEELGPEANVFRNGHPRFTESDQETILSYCSQTGCSDKFLRGYGESGLLLAFKHGSPNNSIPLLWYSKKEWKELFRRSGL